VVAGKVEDQAKGPVAFESIVFVINQVRECVLSSNVLSPADFRSPAVLLSGTVDYQMYNSFRDQFGRAPTTGLVVIELSTLGGDPEVARMMGRMCAITATSIGPSLRLPWKGGHLFRRYNLHVVLRRWQSLSHSRHSPHDS
jgi:hypothetical protein